MADDKDENRRRWINIGEAVAVAGLVISALALWNSWRSDGDSKPTTVVEQPRAIPLALRGVVEDKGKAMRIEPVESGHALDSLDVTALPPGSGTAPFGNDPVLSAAMVESWLPEDAPHEGTGSLIVRIDSRYIERGETRTARQRYRVSFGWVDGSFLSGKTLRLTRLSRA